MRRSIGILLFATGVSAAALVAQAQGPAPKPVTPDNVKWAGSPLVPGLQGAWFVGEQDKPGIYAFRVKLPAGAKIPPHTHPDERNSTVLSGTLYVGFGESFDEGKLVALPAGSMYVAPANVAHFLWAKDGDVTYQEAGFGPTATKPVKK